jgi:hypothetical protein
MRSFLKTPNAKGPRAKKYPDLKARIWSSARHGMFLAFGALAFGISRAHAADAPPAPAGKVELPPMLVEESISSVPWLYVNAGGTEFLSRCSASTTRALAGAWLEKMQLVRVLVPPEFLVRMDVPTVFVRPLRAGCAADGERGDSA